MTMATADSIDIKGEFEEETFENKSSDIFHQNEEIAQIELSSEDKLFETPTFIKIEDPEENCENPTITIADKFSDPNKCFEKEETGHNCWICGSNTNTTEFSREKWMSNKNWRKECAETICDILLTSDSLHFNQFFQIAQYCSACQKQIWEADFTRRLMISLQKTIDKLSIALRRKFALNFIQLKASQKVDNTKSYRPSTSKNVGLPGNLTTNEVDQRFCTRNASFNDFDVLTNMDVQNQIFTKLKIGVNINSNTKAKRSKQKNKRWTNKLKPHSRRALETNHRKMSPSEIQTQDKYSTATKTLESFNLAGIPKKRGRPKKEIRQRKVSRNSRKVHNELKENKLLLDNTSPVNETNNDYADDYNESQDDGVECEIDEGEVSLEKQTELTLEDDILNTGGRVTRRHRRAPQRFTFEDTRLHSDESSDGILSEEDSSGKSKRFKGTKEELKDEEEDYVPEKGESTDMEKWWRQKAKEKFKRKHPNPTNFPCPNEGCNNTYKRKDYLEKHIRIVHEGIHDYHCDFCPKTFYTKTKLDRHKMSHPENNITIDDPEYFKPIREHEFTCTICGQGYNSEEELTAHNEIHAGPNPFVCCHCKKECNNASELKAHITMEHDDETPKCNFCGKTFVSNRSLQLHKKIHLNPEDCFKCPHCPFVSPSENALNGHIARRHGETEGVQCETCGKTLKNALYLRNHMMTHTGEKAYKCRVCEKSYSTNGIRNRHERIHSGIRPHVCSFCGKALTTADNLKVHELIHTRDPNVPLPKRIYKKPFPKKKKKAKPPNDNETGGSSSSQSQTI